MIAWNDLHLCIYYTIFYLEDLGKFAIICGGSDRCVPEVSDSHSGITLKAGRLGGIEEDGEVSLLRLLSTQASESETFPAGGGGWDRRDNPDLGNVPLLDSYLSLASLGEAGWEEETDIIPEPPPQASYISSN